MTLVATYGRNAVPVSDLLAPKSSPDPGVDSQGIHLVELVKLRRGGAKSHWMRTLTDLGANPPGRLIF